MTLQKPKFFEPPLDPLGSVAVQVREIVQQRIVTNALPPGSRLSENELSASLGISRQPVREALIRLSEHHLVRALPQRGTEVTRISLSYAENGRFIRQAVECSIVAEAARRATDKGRSRLHQSLREQRAAAAADDQAEFLRLDDQFHLELARLGGHEKAWDTLKPIKLHMDRVRHLSLNDAASIIHLVDQHSRIVEAIDKNDPVAASTAMQDHLANMIVYLPSLAERLPHLFTA